MLPPTLTRLLTRFAPWYLPVAAFASFVQLVGGGWDINWHLAEIPEVFWTPPHVVLYAGASVVIAATGATFLLRWAGVVQPRSVRLPVTLAFSGALLQVVAGAFDQAWHAAFGADDALSPPHVLLTSALLLTAISLLVALHGMRRQEAVPRTATWVAHAVAAASVGWALWGLLFVTLFPGFNATRWLVEPFGWRLFVGAAFAMTTPLIVFSAARFVGKRGAATVAAGTQVAGFVAISALMGELSPLTAALSPIFLIPGILVDLVYRPGSARAPYVPIALGAVVGQFAFLTGGIVDVMTAPWTVPAAFALAYVAGGVAAALIALSLGDLADGMAAKDPRPSAAPV